MRIDDITETLSARTQQKYWHFIAENDGKCCEKCRRFSGRIFSDDDPAKPELPLHPNCRCTFKEASPEDSLQAMEIPDLSARKPAYAGSELSSVLDKLKYIYKFKVPKPPRLTDNKANWGRMTWMWFFEKGKNPIRFDCNSPESRDIAESYSMQEVKKEYFRTGKIPKKWSFSSIRDFKLENGIATFTVYNKSGWHSGTRLPKSWSQALKKLTGYELRDLVTDAPRGEVLKTKIEKYFPNASKIPVFGYILKLLPSFGGDWEQYYEIRMEWKE